VTTHPVEPRTVGEYTVQARLGEGGMGIVYLARHRDGSRAALKVLRPHIISDERSRERLAREVDALARVRSPWVAEIIDADPWGPTPYVVTRYVPGPSLHDRVTRRGPLVGDDLMWLAGCLAEGISAVHDAGVLHRDVKPANVLLEGRTPILIDFGLARVADDAQVTQAGWLLGTPGYLAPEILYGQPPTPAADVHAWAATVAYAGTGRNPFGSGPSMAIMDRTRRGEHDITGLHGRLGDLVEAALAPDPRTRPLLSTLRGDLHRPDGMSVTPAAPTEMLPVGTSAEETIPDDAEPEEEWEEPEWVEPDPTPEPAGFLENLRRACLILLSAVVIGAGVTVAPLVALAVVVAVAWLLRTASLTAEATADRRLIRGRHWTDGPRAVLSAPVHLLRGIAGTLGLTTWCLAVGGSVGVIGHLLEVPVPFLLFGGGVVAGLALWVGPGAGRFRSPAGRMLRPLARRPLPWCIGCVVLLLAAAVLGGLQGFNGTDWFPLSGPPW
jgi:hypothetical protein